MTNPRLVLALDRRLVTFTVNRDALAAWFVGLGADDSLADWRLNAWQLLHDHADRWRLNRLWRPAPHVHFAQLSPDRQTVVALSLFAHALEQLRDVPLDDPRAAMFQRAAPLLLPWLRDRIARRREELRAQERAAAELVQLQHAAAFAARWGLLRPATPSPTQEH